MEQIAAVLSFIDQHESLFSGIAALIAIGGVCVALLLNLKDRLARQPLSREAVPPVPRPAVLHQDIQYTRANGARIAWTAIGSGTPLVRSLGWFTNLELEWAFPQSRACVETLARDFRYVRYDARGMGLSDRKVAKVSSATRLQDLEAVMDAAGIERCILMGLSEGGTTAIEYAAKHPHRVSHLVLWGSFLRQNPEYGHLENWRALMPLIEKQWGNQNRSLMQLMTALFLPEGDARQNDFFNNMQRQSASASVVMQTLRSIGQVDVSAVAATLQVPTLVMHRVDDLAIPVGHGRELAATIPGARLVQLEGSNHWMHSDPQAFSEILTEIRQFVATTPAANTVGAVADHHSRV